MGKKENNIVGLVALLLFGMGSLWQFVTMSSVMNINFMGTLLMVVFYVTAFVMLAKNLNEDYE